VAAAIVGAFLLIWFAIDSNGPSEVRGQESRTGSAVPDAPNSASDAGERIAQLHERIRTLETERNSALQQLGSRPAPAPEKRAVGAIDRAEPSSAMNPAPAGTGPTRSRTGTTSPSSLN
jgi:hypothetical protein